MTEILVLYFSHSGNTEKLARQVARGVESVAGVSAVLRTVPSLDSTQKNNQEQGAPLAEMDDLKSCHGLIIGSPVRFGIMAAEMKHFIDQTGPEWISGTLKDKPAAVFTSGGSQHGGQESTLLGMSLPLLHHGMLLLGLPFTDSVLRNTKSGGSPYGASHVSGNNGDLPADKSEKHLAQSLGARVANIAHRLNS